MVAWATHRPVLMSYFSLHEVATHVLVSHGTCHGGLLSTAGGEAVALSAVKCLHAWCDSGSPLGKSAQQSVTLARLHLEHPNLFTALFGLLGAEVGARLHDHVQLVCLWLPACCVGARLQLGMGHADGLRSVTVRTHAVGVRESGQMEQGHRLGGVNHTWLS